MSTELRRNKVKQETELIQSMADSVEVDSAELPSLAIRLTDSIVLRIIYFIDSWNYSISCPSIDRAYSAELIRYSGETKEALNNEEEYPAFTFYNSLVEWIQDHPPPSLPVKLTIESDPIESILAPLAIKEAVIWSHHLLATSKRKDILRWSESLELFGISKPGYPGIVVIEGMEGDVDEFLRKIKALNWQALQVRHTLTTPLNDTSLLDRQTILREKTKFGIHGSKIGCIEMETLSEVAEFMRKIGMEDGLKAILKIQ